MCLNQWVSNGWSYRDVTEVCQKGRRQSVDGDRPVKYVERNRFQQLDQVRLLSSFWEPEATDMIAVPFLPILVRNFVVMHLRILPILSPKFWPVELRRRVCL